MPKRKELWATVRVPAGARARAERLIGIVKQRGWEALGASDRSGIVGLGSIFDLAVERLEESIRLERAR